MSQPVSIVNNDMVLCSSSNAIMMLEESQVLSSSDEVIHQRVGQLGEVGTNILHLCPHH